MQRKKTTGFTLIELTVVITIAVILTAIIFPVFANASRAHAQQICMNNLRTLGVLLAQYYQDHDEYPAAPLAVYLRTLDPVAMPFSHMPYHLSTPTFTGTGQNEGLTVGGDFKGLKKTRFQVKIDGTGDPDTFAWSTNNGADWSDPGTPITGSTQSLPFGVTITFPQTTGHATADCWTFYASPLDAGWRDQQPVRLTMLAAQATAGDTIVTAASVTGLHPGMHVLLHDADPTSKLGETRVIASVDPDTNAVTLTEGLRNSYSIDSPLDGRVDNFGLATLYYLDTNSEKKLTQVSYYHCPRMDETEEVDQSANIKAVSEDGSFRTFDPLFGGYNTYDVTYNYDRFNDDIGRYDIAMGYGDTLNAKRQLSNPYAPGDTVVCWCYGHSPEKEPTYSVPDVSNSPIVPDVAGNGKPYDFATYNRRNYKAVVLWLDGSVGAMGPKLERGKNDYNGQPAYYWVPPFLYSPEDWRK